MKRTIFIILAALLLSGCADSGESVFPETADTSAAQTSSAVQTSSTAQTTATEETAEALPEPLPQDSLIQLIRKRIAESDPDASPDVVTVFYEDFDGDGSKDLIAADGGMEIYDGEAYYYGNLWEVSEGDSFAYKFRASDNSAMTGFKRLTAGGDELFSFELYSDTSEYNKTELWSYNGASYSRIQGNGSASLCITQTDDCEFTAFATGYGANTDGTGRVYLPYDLHYDSINDRLVKYRYREITFDEYLEYCCGFGQSIYI